MVYIFHISIVLPFVFYFSSISYHRRSKIIKYINFSIIIMIFVIFFYHHMFFMAQSISIVYLILTSGNVICLIFLIIAIILFREKERFSSPNQNIQIIN